jgi:acyl dehydratase
VNNPGFPESLALDCGPVTAVDLALFAAASGDHNPLHLDIEVARAAGFDRPLVHGMLTMAYGARLFTHHFGAGSLRSLQTRFTGVARLGDTLRLTATLEKVNGGLGHYQLRAQTAAGAELANGQAVVHSGDSR